MQLKPLLSQKTQAQPLQSHKKQSQTKHADLVNFVEKNFRCYQCPFYSKREGTTICRCGEKDISHPKLRISKGDRPWNWTLLPSKTVGEFDFRHPIRTKYVRLSTELPPTGAQSSNNVNPSTSAAGQLSIAKKVVDLMVKHWDMVEPNLSIFVSVVGSIENDERMAHFKTLFKESLLNFAMMTNAWIITDGMNTGLSRMIADTVRKYTVNKTRVGDRGKVKKLRCIGIRPWEGVYLEHHKQLDFSDSRNTFPVVYNAPLENADALNVNHSEYIFLDTNPSKLDSEREPASERVPASERAIHEFRVNLITELYRNKNNDNQSPNKIPAIQLIFGGNLETIYLCYLAVKQDIHVVICSETGGAASFIEKVITDRRKNVGGSLDATEVEEQDLQDMCNTDEDSNKNKERFYEYLEYMKQIINNEAFVIILADHEVQDFEYFIISKLTAAKTVMMGNIDCSGVRSREISSIRRNNEDKDNLKEVHQSFLFHGLLIEKIDLINILDRSGVAISDCVTVKLLVDLYKTVKLNIDNIPAVISEICDFSDLKYDNESLLELKNDDDVIPNAHDELFIWSVIAEKHKVANYLWEYLQKPLSLTLVAVIIYKKKMRSLHGDRSEERDILESRIKLFSEYSSSLIKECEAIDRDRNKGLTDSLLRRQYPQWDNYDALKLGFHGHVKQFMTTPPYQSLLRKIFQGDKGCWSWPFSPQVKFCMDIVCYIIFLLCYCTFILIGIKDDYMHPLEWVAFVYLVSLSTTEIYEITRTNLTTWWKFHFWNKFDGVVLLIHLLAFVLRGIAISSNNSYSTVVLNNWSRTLYAIAAIIYVTRILRFCSASEHLGDKVVIIVRMIEKMALYFVILAVALLAYGVSSQSLLFPRREISHFRDFVGILKDIIFFPYWQLFGEIYLEDVVEVDNICASNLTSINQTDVWACPQKFWLPMFLALYLMVGNVLLLNLLIAIFSNIYSEAQSEAITLWKENWYQLVFEYKDKRNLPIPIVILEHIYCVFCWLKKRDFTTIDQSDEEHLLQQLTDLEKEAKEISHWRRQCQQKVVVCDFCKTFG